MEYREIKGVKHYVYDTVEEFQSNHKDIKPKEWKDNPQEGDWVVADDGGVVQILKRNGISHPNDRKNWKLNRGYVRTVVGTFLLNNKSKMDTNFDLHPNRYTFSKNVKQANENFKNESEKLLTSWPAEKN